MRIVRSIAELREARASLGRLAFVPTMGNLHAGHVSLMHRGREHAPHVAVSIFVNRLQFAPHEDFDCYPRTFEADCETLRAAGVDLLFAPDEQVLYPQAQSVRVEPSALAAELEGQVRPRFFHGVSTVVLKLFNCMQAEVAVFGKKDYQQLMVIQQMVTQFDLPIEIIAGETARETDGLAMSSRNQYLSTAERVHAAQLYRTLCVARDAAQTNALTLPQIEAQAMQALNTQGWTADYVSIRRQADLMAPASNDQALVILAAARLGSTRLIDNLEFHRTPHVA